MKKILIATTNVGKFHEFTTEFTDLPFKFVSLKDLHLESVEVPEPYETTWENALHKARYFAQKTKLVTIAEDTGFFVRALDGAPGVRAKRLAATPLERNQKVLQALEGVPTKKRTAYFETSGCIYDPAKDQFTIVKGFCRGLIASALTGKSPEGLGYDSIFFYPPAQKTFAEMSTIEKNLVSHRGKVIAQTRDFLNRQYGFKQFIVPLAIVVKDRKMLLLERRDNRPEFNNKWEFPGGGVENGESIEECLRRETKEEANFAINIIDRVPKIYSAVRDEKNGNYQVFITPYICTIKSGKLKTSDAETGKSCWVNLKQALKMDLLPLNKKVVQENKALLKKYID